ncbi:hypothetical protein L1987_49086 [Smallanthus sonchifolius]|uniref:Uncharacterized protein n=1 Tax=Smallanthus sonchifolius TaxID=185202 RepID=A0ACB9FUS4_9ASTR|nr:hypothetical protein L1987_49086 [Smallanthus sonchifolius]
MVFIDLEKVYDSVPLRLIWDGLEGRGVPGKYIEIIQDMYGRIETSVRAPMGYRLLRGGVAENKQTLNGRLEERRPALENKGLRISRSKTEYLFCDFSGSSEDEDVQIIIEGQVVSQVTKFKYLESSVQANGLDSDVAHRIQAGWCRWRAATSILCNRRFRTKLKGKFYRVAVRPALLYRTKCCASKKTHVHKMEVVEMRMLKWMYGNTRLDRVQNVVFRERLVVASKLDKIEGIEMVWACEEETDNGAG